MASAEAEQLATELRARMGRVGKRNPSVDELRTGGEVMGTLGTERDDVKVEQVDMGGRRALVHIPDRVRNGAILHLHGGGLTLGSPESHSRLAAHLAARSGITVYNLNYRLAPENPYPAALDDTAAAFRWLVEQGVPTGQVFLSGDSAGSALALTTLMELHRDGAGVAGGIFMSPWVDFRLEAGSYSSNADSDAMCSRPMMVPLRTNYCPDGDYENPRVSPAMSPNFAGLPPLIVQASATEVLLDDARLVAQRAREAGVDVTYQEYDVVPHVFQLYAGNLPEADDALHSIADWAVRLLADRAGPH